MILWKRLALVTAFAEADERSVRILELRLSAIDPKGAPFLFKVIDVIAWRYDTSVIVGLGIEVRKQRLFGLGQGLRHGVAVQKPHLVAFHGHGVVGQVI